MSATAPHHQMLFVMKRDSAKWENNMVKQTEGEEKNPEDLDKESMPKYIMSTYLLRIECVPDARLLFEFPSFFGGPTRETKRKKQATRRTDVRVLNVCSDLRARDMGICLGRQAMRVYIHFLTFSVGRK